MNILEHIENYPKDIQRGLQDPYVRIMRKKLTIDTMNPDLWYDLGEYLKHLGLYYEAEAALLEVVEIDKYHEFAWFLLALIYEHTSRRIEADVAWDAWDAVKHERDMLAVAIMSDNIAASETT